VRGFFIGKNIVLKILILLSLNYTQAVLWCEYGGFNEKVGYDYCYHYYFYFFIFDADGLGHGSSGGRR
jgi:hypothetical protein